MGILVGSVLSFFSWWRAELASLIPEPVRRRFGGPHRQSVICLNSPTSISFRDIGEEPDASCRLVEFTDVKDKKLQSSLAKLKTTKVTRIVLALSHRFVVRKRITLPLVPHAKIAAMIKFELERLTPFKVEDIYFDFHLVDRDEEQKRLQVDLFVARRSDVDFWNSALRSFGISPKRITALVDDEPADFLNLLAPGEREVVAGRQGLSVTLVCATCILIAANIYLPFYSLNAERDALSAQVLTLRERMKVLTTVRSRVDEYQAMLDFTHQLNVSAAQPIMVINELTKKVPDHTWIYELDYSPEKIRISGQSEDASSLVSLIEASPMFHSAEFPSAVVRDQGGLTEQFIMQIDFQSKPTSPETN